MVDLFPASVLDNSILTSVLFGLLVTWALQETLGWNFSGLVVPGYLASILAIQPETGAVVVIEACLTYALVYVLSELTPRHWPNSRLFGRDRFYALLLASVTVRLAVEGVGLDALSEALGRPLSPALHAMGLLVMPLGANALWRTGLGVGLVRLGVPVLVTWAALEWVLLPLTNLSMTSFELTYEDLAVDFESSPKAYLLMLGGAWLGSYTNRAYGYDFGGIIVPGLLTVCWMWPQRVAGTIGEALLVWALLAVLVRLPGVRRANLAGGRLLVLAFVAVYLVKFGLGWAVWLAWPGVRIHDLFGFGYLLPTLMGLRMHKHGEPFRFLIPTVGVSLVAFFGAGALGYALSLALPAPRPPADRPSDAAVIFAAYQDAGPVPTPSAMARSVSGGSGFGTLLRRDGQGPALVARAGSPGLAASVLELAPAIDARAVLLCARDGEGCDRGYRVLAREGQVWWVEASVSSWLQARGDDLTGVDVDALADALPGITLRAGAVDRTRLGLGSLERANAKGAEAALTRLAPDEERPAWNLGRLRAVRYEVAPGLTRFAAGDTLAPGIARAAAEWFGWGVSVDGDTLVLSGDDVVAQVRRGAAPVVLHLPEARAPGLLPLAMQLASSLDARALVIDAPPSLHREDELGTRPTDALLLAMLEAWPDAAVLELRGMRDVVDVDASWGWSAGTPLAEEPPLVQALTAIIGDPGAPFGDSFTRFPLRGPPSALREALPEGRHVVGWVDTRLRHRFVAFDEVTGAERAWATLGRDEPLPAWARPLLPRVRAAMVTGDLGRLRDALDGSGVTVRLRCTRQDQCGWIELERCDGRCERAWIPRFRGLDGGGEALGDAPRGRR